MSARPQPIAEIEAAIVRYLERHPDAADTAEGIAKWWLPVDWDTDVDRVGTALVHLLSEGRVQRHRNADNQELFCGRTGPA